jgi:hypothetical protein
MATQQEIDTRDPILPTPDEQAALAALLRLLSAEPAGRLLLVDEAGAEVELPASARTALRRGVAALASDHGIFVRTVAREVTVHQAAAILRSTTQYVAGLVERGELPTSMRGSIRVIPLTAVLKQLAFERAKTREGLRLLTQLSQEYGLYDLDISLDDLDDEPS